jgi:DNA polymerase III alpha subunit
MKHNQYGQMVFSQEDLCDLAMSGHDVTAIAGLITDDSVVAARLLEVLEKANNIQTWIQDSPATVTVEEFDRKNQQCWFMPDAYRQLDIAEYILGLCTTPEQLQRAGEELLLYQDRELFDLLRYLKYLVDTMKQHGIMWGVGRGSSVASYVLYLLEVHRIDSMFYDLNPREFLR